MIISPWGLLGAAIGLGFGLYANLLLLPRVERSIGDGKMKSGESIDAETRAKRTRIVRMFFRSELIVLPVMFYFAFSSIKD
jgi:hypothetical protein